MRGERDELGGRAGAGEHQDGVAGLEDAEVAVHRVGGMQEDGGGAGAAEGGGDLLPDERGLADAGDDDLATGLGEDADGILEGRAEARGEVGQGGGLGGEEGLGGGEGSHIGGWAERLSG